MVLYSQRLRLWLFVLGQPRQSHELQLIDMALVDRIESLHQEIITRYTYSPEAPQEHKESYWVYEATHNDLKIPVTLKIIRHPPPELVKYLKRFKELKAENIVKIYEIFDNQDGLFLSTEPVTFSNLKIALQKCKKLDDFDAIFIAKIILASHADLLRAGFEWFGTEQDIEFTNNGIKLSWNNSIPFESQCPFPLIFSRMAGKMETIEQKILPFPKSKVLEDLISLSGRNASEIGLSPHMKKKQKLSKKRGRNWICLKESKNDLEYYEQIVYFAVHKEIGFARIKSYNAGKLDEDILSLNKTKTTFTRAVETYEENGKTYIVSEYSNDGSLFNYVNKLKANSIALKEDQIQFFFFSLFEPLKLIQDSPIKSLCMLHIKNIYIENGIPKIGEPVPMNKELRDQLREKSDVPDFYHTLFKKNPTEKTNTFDTYSLGVLMYKLMFTQYPIFPQGRVHIPTTPPYNKRLKTTLQLFLNEGGLLKDLEKKIEVGEEVAKQVRINKGKLLQQKKLNAKSKQGIMIEEVQDEMIERQKDQKKQDRETEGQMEQVQEDDNQDCCRLCCAQLEDPQKHKSFMLDSLEESPYASYRLCIKSICVLILYVFLFYFFFIQNTFKILSNKSSLSRMNVTISTVNYQVTVSSADNFFKVFNVTDRSIGSLVGTGCFVNSYNGSPDYSTTAINTSYQAYVVFALITMIILITFKLIQLGKFDFIKTLYNMSNVKTNFNMSNYLIFNFFLCSFVNDHYIFFNQVFNSITDTCLGITYGYNFGSTDYYYSDSSKFLSIFFVMFLLHFVALLLLLIMVVRTDKIRYTRIFNPIILFLPLLIIYTVIVRVGVISEYFYPSLMKNISLYGKFFSSSSYVNVIGAIPEIMFLFEFLIELLIDWIFWATFDKRRRMLINDISSAGIII